MDFDSNNIQPGLLAGLLASCYAFVNHIPALFGAPPIERRTVYRAIAEIFIAFPISMIAGYALAVPLSYIVTSALTLIWSGLAFDPIAAGVLLGFMGVHGLRHWVNRLVEKALNK